MTRRCNYWLAAVLFCASLEAAPVTGVVVDPQGAAVAQAVVELRTPRGSIEKTARTDVSGAFRLEGVPQGVWELAAWAPGFQAARRRVRVASDSDAISLHITLSLDAVVESVTVTTAPGSVEDPLETPQPVTVVTAVQAQQGRAVVLPQVLRDQPGLHVQQTSPHQGAILVRGLTGQQVVTLIDGVRLNNATFRSGPNQYQALIDPSLMERVEVTRGPNSVQYGSDALGGTVHVLTHRHGGGKLGLGLGTADWSGSSDVTASVGGPRLGMTVTGFGSRINDLRSGGGVDSHAAVTRFLGLPSSVLGGRLQDTAFTGFGGSARLAARPASDQHVTVYYARSQQEGGRRYDQLNGGNGNLQHRFDPQALDFFYGRWEKTSLGLLDSLSATFSWNRIRDDRQTQGGDPASPVTWDFARTDSFGYQAQATSHVGSRHIFGWGAELFDEKVRSRLYRVSPATGATGGPQRPRFPDGARYRSAAAHAQNSAWLLPNRWRLVAGLRYSAFRYHAAGEESLAAEDLTYQLGSSYFLTPGLSLNALLSRGFRAPNINDLSQIGLTSNGFEVAAAEAVRLGASVRPLRPESLLNYEAGLKLRRGVVTAEASFFLAGLHNFITKRDLILPAGMPGRLIGGEPIVSQDAAGRVFVPLDSRPVVTRTNLQEMTISGVEFSTRLRLGSDWTLRGNFFRLRGRDKFPAPGAGDAPNLEGGLPPAAGSAGLRYQPGSRWWLEAASNLAWRQDRLSALELADQRVGAARSRAAIGNYFQNGARARGLVVNGILAATGETLAQVQDRVLGPGVAAAPWFRSTPGYAIFHLRAGIELTERSTLGLLIENLLDRNYRSHGSGVDGAGFHAQVRYSVRF